ncbi:MAG: hypothetical protein Q4A64_02685 [Porphyromonadaceae bacterium]|nr:hypothetical protein [Porphyromonadaceae bacterium]
MIHSTNQPTTKGSFGSSIFSFVRLLLKRPIYILASLLFVVGIKVIWRPAKPMPTREYFTTFRIKYSDPGQGYRVSKALETEPQQSYRPQWAMVNPYDRDIAVKYFESTQIVVNAGERLNYTVDYWHEGKNIYPDCPIDVRFISEEIDDFDAWQMKVDVREDGVVISGIRGNYKGKAIEQAEPLSVPFGKITQTPVGPVEVKRVRPTGVYKELMLKRMSDIDAQEKYDSKLRRYMGSNLIELFLMADCTHEFARDYLREIGLEYERYAREAYRQGLDTYLARLARARQGLLGEQSLPLDEVATSLGLKSASGRTELLAQIDRLIQEAQANALILEEQSMLEVIDDAFIRSPKQGVSPQAYITFGLVVLFILIPILATLLELLIRRPVLGRGTLPEDWQTPERLIPLPKAKAPFLKWDFVRLDLNRQQQAKRHRVILLASLTADTYTDTVVQSLEQTYLLAGDHVARAKIHNASELDNLLEQCSGEAYLLVETPALDASHLALELQQSRGYTLALILRNTRSNYQALEELYEWYQGHTEQPTILWDDQI